MIQKLGRLQTTKTLLALKIGLVAVVGLGTFLFFGGQKVAAMSYSISPSSACTFFDAIQASDSDGVVGSCAGGTTSNTITMAGGTYYISSALPEIINNPLTINGAGPGSTVINGQNAYAGLEAAAGATFNISNLTITDMTGTGLYNDGVGGSASNIVVDDPDGTNGIYWTGAGTLSNIAVINEPNGDGLYIAADGGSDTVTNLTSDSNNIGLVVFATATTNVNIINATIANNSNSTGPTSGVALINSSGSTSLNLENTILSGNLVSGAPANCGTGTVGPFTVSLPTSQGSVLSSDDTCGFIGTTSHNNVNLELGAITLDNGTYVLPITYNSPAYNSGSPYDAPSTDQRGASRPTCGGYDVGAYQTTTCTPTVPSSGGSSSSSSTSDTKKSDTTTPTTSTPATSTTSKATTTQTNSNSSTTTSPKSVKSTADTKKSNKTLYAWILIIILVLIAGFWFWLIKHPKLHAKLFNHAAKKK